MLIVRFKVRCTPGKSEAVMAALQEIVHASRSLDGVLGFDIGRDILDADSFIATEVFTDRTALDRQEALPAVKGALAIFEESLAAAPEATIFEVSSSEPWGD